jgi:predicted DNA-binding transcriptional regulator YafY
MGKNAIIPLTFTYTNYKGIISNRKVMPINLYWGSTEYHEGDQWLLKAFDLGKDEIRIFAVKDILGFKGEG